MTTESQTPAQDPCTLLIRGAVLDWPNIFKPGGKEGDTPRFGAQLLLKPDHPQIEEIWTAIRLCCKNKWKDKAKEMFDLLKRKDMMALHDGNDKVLKYPYMANLMYVTTARPQDRPRPTTFNQSRKEIMDEKEGYPLFYRGAIVNARVNFWPQDNKFGQRVNGELLGVQFWEHGSPLGAGGRTAGADEFEAIAAPADTGGADDWA